MSVQLYIHSPETQRTPRNPSPILCEKQYLSLLKQETKKMQASNQYKLTTLGNLRGCQIVSQTQKIYKVQRRKDVKSLSFDTTIYRDEELAILYRNLKIGSKYLEELYFDELYCFDLSLTGMRNFVKILRIGYPRMKKFTACFLDMDMDDENKMASEIYNSFKSGYDNLKTFALEVDYVDCIMLRYLAGKILPRMNKITSLMLKLRIPEEGLKKSMTYLGGTLNKKYQQLKELTFKLEMTEISDLDSDNRNEYNQGFKSFLKGLQTQRTNLTHLSLVLNNFRQINDDHMMDLSKYLEEIMPRLISLNLDFTKAEIGDNGFNALLSPIQTNLKHLERLNLNFGHCRRITDASMAALSAILSEGSEKLQDLSLQFNNCPDISNEGIRSLSKGLSAPFPHISRLNLPFYNIGEVETKIKVDLYEVLCNKYQKIKRFYMNVDNRCVGSFSALLKYLEESRKNLTIEERNQKELGNN